jgi:DNA-dependent RNA polymerase auxiliary subunit epsilon
MERELETKVFQNAGAEFGVYANLQKEQYHIEVITPLA